MRTVVMESDREYQSSGLLIILEDLSKGEFEFKHLHDVLPREMMKGKAAIDLSKVTPSEIRGAYAVVWNPNPMEFNWFEMLDEHDYSGKKIVIVEDDNEEVTGRFTKYAHHAIKIPTEGIAEQIYTALKEPQHLIVLDGQGHDMSAVQLMVGEEPVLVIGKSAVGHVLERGLQHLGLEYEMRGALTKFPKLHGDDYRVVGAGIAYLEDRTIKLFAGCRELNNMSVDRDHKERMESHLGLYKFR